MRHRALLALALAALVAGAAACGGGKQAPGSSSTPPAAVPATVPGATPVSTTVAVPAAIATEPTVTVPSGPPPTQLVTKDLVIGTGAVAKTGDNVLVQYVGVNYADGKVFDASWTDGPNHTPQPFPFQLGAGQVIAGWDQGVPGMRVGGRRELIIPPSLGYGNQAQGPITANETLVFVVDLLSVS
jgi:peptidylprolyl isomerase